MYLRRVEIDGRSYEAAPTQVSTVVTPPAPAALSLGVGLPRPCSAWASWLPHWLTCMCAISREDSIGRPLFAGTGEGWEPCSHDEAEEDGEASK
jgi:hypothetical protein